MSTDNEQRREMLDVEDEDTRHRRLEAYMRTLDASGPTAATTSAFTFNDRKTFAVQPPTELLARVQSFLPQMEVANAILSQRLEADPKSVDIEHLSDGIGQYIEMNLGLGVFEQRANSDEHLDFKMGSSSLSSSSDTDEEDDVSDTDSDESSEIITAHSASPRIIKPLPRRTPSAKSPRIEVLGGDSRVDVEELPESKVEN